MFKVDCGGDRFSDMSHLSDAQLASRLRELGADVGPIIDATRGVYQRKLQRWLQSRNPRYNVDLDETREELEEARPPANRLAPESNPFSAYLQHQESPRQYGGCTGKLLKDTEHSRCKESKEESSWDICESASLPEPSAESLENHAGNASPSRSSNSLRYRFQHETGEDERMFGHNRTKTGFDGGISSVFQRAGTATVSPMLFQPRSRCLQQQVHWFKKPMVLAGLFVIMLLCLIFVLIVFNMEPEYQNPALL